jgi:hypothetical protein
VVEAGAVAVAVAQVAGAPLVSGSSASARQALLLLLPAARILPALAALGLLTAFLIVLAGHERLIHGEQPDRGLGDIHLTRPLRRGTPV